MVGSQLPPDRLDMVPLRSGRELTGLGWRKGSLLGWQESVLR